MTILNPDHLLNQGRRLFASGVGSPRQVDVRRVISAAYYGVCHFVLARLADQFVGAGARQRVDPRYALVYRSVDHGRPRGVCARIARSALGPRDRAYAAAGGFSDNLADFALAAVRLQEGRHSADYDPVPRFRKADALAAVREARTVIERFRGVDVGERQTFLMLLLCTPR